MSWTTDLIRGYALLLADAGIGVWRDDSAYAEGDVGITDSRMPDQPHHIIALFPYAVEDDSGLTDVVQGLQIRLRGAPGPDARPVRDREDAIYDLLHMREHTTVSGIHVALSWRQSWAWIGADTRGRLELTANYYLRAVRPAPHLIET
ncbi:minor capsid protein [Streptomyces sp. DSM 44917]|uniref:Minor capsid protein n=1 Tax=Streptomyces boetiae TaxID=3075541 RepID=A0ABU2L3J0_9ACTN|nr:minor capsid protein [Streptomyces sp. DSM 44917]MDT0306129.1 minor capsid protein [Streptomyces sp. DSM 44917]